MQRCSFQNVQTRDIVHFRPLHANTHKNTRRLFCVIGRRHARSQNFDADSTLYTPISKPNSATTKQRSRPFQDTIQNQKLIKYFFELNAGALTGCDNCTANNSTTFTASTVHGLTIGKKFRAGAGIGFDSYEGWQTLPFFGQLGYDLLGTRSTNALFLEARYGWSHAWDNRVPFQPGRVDVDGGSTFSGQIGYGVKYHNLRLGLLFGFRQQFVFSTVEYPTYYWNGQGILVEGAPNTMSLTREMRRVMISLQVGWQ